MKIRRKKPFTLMEVMLAIAIIAIVGSVFGYNMKGSLEKGKAFKSEQGSKQIHDILTLSIAEGALDPSEPLDEKAVSNALIQSGLVKDIKKLMKDGWGFPYEFSFSSDEEVIVRSDKWLSYLKDKQKLDESKIQESYPWAFSETS